MKYKEYRQEFNKQLESFLSHEIKQVPQDLKPYYEIIREFVMRGGKRLRPMAVILSYVCSGGNPKKIMLPAVAVELHHNYSLILDDLMDGDKERRGKPTVHEMLKKTGQKESFAIMLGNLTNILSKKAFMKADFPDDVKYKALELLENTDQQLYHGQMYDLMFETVKPTEEQYLEMAEFKTGALFGASFQLGALLAGKDEHTQHELNQFGRKLGIMFQLQDDLGDIEQDRRAGKNTLVSITSETHCRKLMTQMKDDLKKILSGISIDNKQLLKEFSENAVKLP